MAWYDYIGLGGLGKGINSYLHPEKGYENAEDELRKSWNQAIGIQKPYLSAGQNQLPALTGTESELLNPSALLAKWMNEYQESPAAQQDVENAKAQGQDIASSMGLSGSSAAQNNITQLASQIMNKDRQQFLTDLMNKYLTGIGIGQNIYGVGANTAGALGQEALGMGQNLAQTQYNIANAPGQRIADLLALAAKAGASAGAA